VVKEKSNFITCFQLESAICRENFSQDKIGARKSQVAKQCKSQRNLHLSAEEKNLGFHSPNSKNYFEATITIVLRL
jgi:hypothetical protein